MKRWLFVLFVLLPLILQGCLPFEPAANNPPYLLFAQGGSDCRFDEEAERASLSFSEGILTFSGTIATSSPCQHLIPSLTVCGKNILVKIAAIAKPGACPLCLGVVDYGGSVVGLSQGAYRVRIKHEDRTLVDLWVTINS
jgi:hypothetical protein